MDNLVSLGFGINQKAEHIVRDKSNHTGFLSKAWYYINRERYLVKGNSYKACITGYEPYSEVLAACVAEQLGIPHVEYILKDAYKFPSITVHAISHVSICKEIPLLAEEQLVSFNALLNPIGFEDFGELMNLYSKLQLPDEDMYRMLLFDALIGNTDRHLNNWEYIVSANSIKPAPLYDHGAGFRSQVSEDNLLTCGDLYPDDAKSFGLTHKEIIYEVKDRYKKKLFYIDYKKLEKAFRDCLKSLQPYLSDLRVNAILAYFEARVDEYLSPFI